MSTWLVRLLLPLVALAGLTPFSLSQGVLAALVGPVTDAKSLPVPGASVSATNEATNQAHRTVTSSAGIFAITHLPPGIYRVTVTAPGFQTFSELSVRLEASEVRRLPVQLQVGSLHTEVTATAPSGRLDTDSAARGELIPARLVDGLPLNDRNYINLAGLVPGIYHRVGSDEQGEGLSASGTRADAAGFALDGLVNRSDRSGTPGVGISLEAVREFDVQMSSLGAASGRTGGVQVTVVSRSGTNRLRGSLFDYLRHEAFDARNTFTPPGESAPLRRQQLGGSLGGPLRRDRAFFFAAYERLRERRSLAANTTAPHSDWLRGDFRNLRKAGSDGIWGNSDDTNRLVDPLSRKEFPTPNLIPDSKIDPVARRMVPFVPAANLAGTLDGYAASGRVNDDRHTLTGRLDTFWKSGAAVSARWSAEWGDAYDPFSALRNFYPGFGRYESRRLDSMAVTGIKGFGRQWVNEARIGYFSHQQDRTAENSSTDYVSQFGIPINLDRSLWGFPSIRIDGFAEFGDRPNDPSIFTVRNSQFSDTVSRAVGAHTVSLGLEVVRSTYRETDLRSIRGDFRFRGRN
ncbi:MAG: carboxypeptidase regulatory-like domain-containing protein, partial [Acidobacteria bacterium]